VLKIGLGGLILSRVKGGRSWRIYADGDRYQKSSSIEREPILKLHKSRAEEGKTFDRCEAERSGVLIK